MKPRHPHRFRNVGAKLRTVLWVMLWCWSNSGFFAASALEDTAIELPPFVADNMVLQRKTALGSVSEAALWGRSRQPLITVRFKHHVWNVEERRVSGGWFSWVIPLRDLEPDREGHELRIESTSRRKGAVSIPLVFTNVVVGDVWLWPCESDPRTPRAALLNQTDLAEFSRTHLPLLSALQRFPGWVRVVDTRLSASLVSPGALPALSWRQGDSGSVSASACFFLAAELESAKWEVPVGVIHVPVADYRTFIRSAKDWEEAVRGQVNVDTLMGANRIRTDFVSTVGELHTNNLNDFKLLGIVTNDAPLPGLELNSVFMRPPLQMSRTGEPLHLWPFRCAVVPAK